MEISNLDLNKKIWDHYQVSERNAFHASYIRLRYLAKKVVRSKNSGRVLDIGLGDGFLLKEIFDINSSYELFGIDPSQDTVSLIGREFEQAHIPISLHMGSIEHLPFPDNYFDIITASEVIEHLDENIFINGLKEVSRVLKPQGYFLATTPANERLEDLMCYCPNCGFSFHRWGHKLSFSDEKIQQSFGQDFNGLFFKKIALFGEKRPTGNFFKILKYYIKLIVFHLSRPFLGADYRYYIRANK